MLGVLHNALAIVLGQQIFYCSYMRKPHGECEKQVPI